MKPLSRSFYERKTETVARELLGKTLQFNDKQARITEVEAYLGDKDPASHAYGKLTQRNKIFYGPAGIAYVFMIYGMHWCFNVITGPVGKPGCVLISGIDETFGPGRVSKFFGFTGEHNGLDLTTGPITIVSIGRKVKKITVGPRVGITRGINLPLRFVASDS